jgi:hypothetical protein
MPVAKGLFTLLAGTAAVSGKLGDSTGENSLFQSAANKGAQAPYVVLHLVDVPPAAHSQDGPSGLQNGEIQFDSYAADAPTARALSQSVRDTLKNFSGALSEGTQIEFYEVTMDSDEGYEQGGSGYVFKSLLRLRAFFTESGE